MAADYTQQPLLIYWEMTRACPLACRHCRAEAMPRRDPMELSTAEGRFLLERLARFSGSLPHLVLTGGDPLERTDLFDLIAYARELGFTVAVTPAGTPHLDKKVIGRFREAGVWMMAVSLDGSGPEKHDGLRGVPGSFALTLQAIRWAREAALPVQVNTLVCAETVQDLPGICAQLAEAGIAQWALFFLIQVGRGAMLQEVTPERSEEVMRWAYEAGQAAPFRIRTTEAPHYRRAVLELEAAKRRGGQQVERAEHVRHAFGVRDGNGVMFVSHTGEIYPSGFLPILAGNVRRDDPVKVYRYAPLFCALRNPDGLRGRCGVCEYRHVCGGSRARAFAATGDPLESDPLCPYQPGNAGRMPMPMGA